MANRREFLQASAAASIATGIALGTQSPAAAATGADPGAAASLPLALAVYDERFPESRAFAAELERRGVPAQAIAHDVTPLWLALEPRWRAQRFAIAGLTAECSYDCLRRLAWDLGLRTVCHGEHLFQEARAVHHTLSAPRTQLAACGDFTQPDWGGEAARLVALCPARPAAAAERGSYRAVSQELQSSPSRQLEEVLISWVLAPVARRVGPYA